MAVNHTYRLDETTPGCSLCIIQTNASNIKLLNLRSVSPYTTKKLRGSAYLGINGAWFDAGETAKTILNIAMQDGVAVGPGPAEGLNNGVGSGAVAWNGSQLSVYTNKTTAVNAGFPMNSGSWVQGGIALWLGYNQWLSMVSAQSGSSTYLTGSDRRTALIANMSTQKVYLISTPNAVTFATFRSAIQAMFGFSDGAQANQTLQGIMLDGGRSSQLRAKSANNSVVDIPAADVPGELICRELTQLITLKNAN